MQAVGHAAELLVDEKPFEHRPTLAAVLDGHPAAVQARRDRLALDLGHGLLGQRAAAFLGLDLQGHQYALHKVTGAVAKFELLGGQLAGGGGGHAHSHVL